MSKQASWPLKAYVNLLGWSSLLLMLGAVVVGLIASCLYESYANEIENIPQQRHLVQGWAIALLWLPLLLQLLVLIILLRRVRRHKRDQTIGCYFKFYFVRTFLSSFTYVTLWLCYTLVLKFGPNKTIVGILSWLSLFSIALLICFVVQATYLITRSSFRNDKRIFTEKDLKNNYECICKELAKVALEAQGKSTTEKKQGIELIHEWLLKDRDYKVHRVAYKGRIADLDIPHLLEALNRLVCSRRFYNAHNEDGENYEVTLYSIEADNREYIKKNLLEICESQPTGNIQDTTSQSLEAILKVGLTQAGRWIRGKIESLFGVQARTDKRIGRRSGIAMFPFYTMVFFFSIFLCIAYLFGFAFAFEDKYIRLSEKHGALFMTDDLLEDAAQQSTPTPTPEGYKLNELQKVFYFNSGGAGVKVEKIENTNDKNKVAQINHDSLVELIPHIKAALDCDETVRVELVGRADDNAVNKVTYASNYEIAAARIRSVRFLLQQKLIEESVAPGKLAAINWIETPFSNDISLAPKRRKKNSVDQKSENSIAFLVENDGSAEQDAAQKVIEKTIQDLKEENLKEANTTYEEVSKFWGRINKSAQEGPLTESAIYAIYHDIKDWIGLMAKADTVAATRVKDKIQREFYQLEDLKGSKRAVEVFIFHAPSSRLELKPLPEPHSKLMALMDYLYFAMYTITTTGYGDIKPMTTFAKFLCTIANITEFFFIVVFFNTLLSLRQEKGETF